MNTSRGFGYDIKTDTLFVKPQELQAYLNELEIRLKMVEKHPMVRVWAKGEPIPCGTSNG